MYSESYKYRNQRRNRNEEDVETEGQQEVETPMISATGTALFTWIRTRSENNSELTLDLPWQMPTES